MRALALMPNHKRNNMLEKIATALAESYVRHPYRGYGRLNYLVSKLVGPRFVVKRIHQFDFSFDLFDPYWNLLLANNYQYEPEVETFLRCQFYSKPVFVDCGANFGYWTLFALSYLDGCDCISIEASPETFDRLKKNIYLNAGRARLINCAISSLSNEVVWFETSGKNHAGAAISGIKYLSNAKSVKVRTINLKDALKGVQRHRPILIKLDVEGAEIDAIKGIGDLVREFAITIVYEEFEKNCKVTDFLQSQSDVDWKISTILSDGSLAQINHLEARELASKSRGPINLVATN